MSTDRTPRRSTWLVVATLMSIAILISCGDEPTPTSVAIDSAPTEADRRSFPLGVGFTSYLHTYTSTCGDGPYVTDGPVLVWVDRGEPIVLAGVAPKQVATVERVQSFIADAERRGVPIDVRRGSHGQPASVVIEWDGDTDDTFCWESTGLIGSSSNGGGRQLVSPFEVGVIDQTVLDVFVPSCGGDPELLVQESPEEIRLSVITNLPGAGVESPACGDAATVQLTSPVSGRPVIDAKTGQIIEVLDRP